LRLVFVSGRESRSQEAGSAVKAGCSGCKVRTLKRSYRHGGEHADYSRLVPPEDIVTFSTFRKGNEIKWAQRPVVVKKGEYVMTFCGKTVLARCGNLVSVSPMQPSEDMPPALLEDPEEAPAAPLMLASNAEAMPAALPPAAVPAPIGPAVVAAAHHPFWFIPPFYVPPGHGHGGPTIPTSPPIITPGTPSAPPPPGGPLSGDEFDGHQAYITLFIGLFVIGILKLTTR
jgi:hypothetical protein